MKVTTTLLFAMFFSIFTFAQIDFSNINFGVKAGANMSDVFSDFDTSPNISFHVGGYFQAELTDDILIKPELLYSREGFEYNRTEFDSETFEPETINSDFNLDFLTINMVGRYGISETFGFEGGVSGSYLLSANDSFETENSSGERDIKDDLKTIHIGTVLGAYLAFDNGIDITARYTYGFGTIYKSNVFDDSFIDAPQLTRSLIELSIGYTFNK